MSNIKPDPNLVPDDTQSGHAPRRRSPGISARRIRVELFLLSLYWIVRQDHPQWDAERCSLEAASRMERDTRARDPEFMRHYERFGPALPAPGRRQINRHIEMAAVMRIPVIRWLFTELAIRAAGRPTDRQHMLATLAMLASGGTRPVIKDAADDFTGSALACWAYGYPTENSLNNIYPTLKSFCESVDQRLFAATTMDLMQTLRELADEDGELVFPNMGRFAAIDGTKIPGWHQQRAPRLPGERELMFGPTAPNADFAMYGDSKTGRIDDSWAGEKRICVVDLSAVIPYPASNRSATVHETHWVDGALKSIFDYAPDWPLELLVGDSLFDSKYFHQHLEERYSIHGVSVEKGRDAADPQCEHGPAVFRYPNGFHSLAKRQEQGVPRGQAMSLDHAYVRWQCPQGICSPRTNGVVLNQKFLTDPRQHTYIPQGSVERAALLLRRQSVEAYLSIFKQRTAAGYGNSKLRTKNEDTTATVHALADLFNVARRFVHTSGMYEAVAIAAQELGLYRMATREEPSIGPPASELERVERELEELFGAAAEPRSLGVRDLDDLAA